MDAITLLLLVVALAIGAAIGWLIGSRAAAGASQTVDALRLQLDGSSRNVTSIARRRRGSPRWKRRRSSGSAGSRRASRN